MPDSTIVTILTGAGVAGVFCILFVLGLIVPRSVIDDARKERDYERQRADANNERADAATSAAQATRDVLSALQAGVQLGHQHREDLRAAAMRENPELRGPGGA